MTFNALRFFQDYQIDYKTEGKNCQAGWVNINCTEHPDSTFHLGYNISLGYFNCWHCGKLKITNIIQNLLNTNYYETKQIIDEYTEISSAIVTKKKEIKHTKNIKLPGKKLQKQHKNYLKNRNFDPDYIENKYKILGTGYVGEYKNRIIIPIFLNGKLVSYQGRDITNKHKLRYKACSLEESIINPKHTLYNIDNCEENDSIIVVEGVFDVWRIGDGCCCTFGTAISEYQLAMLCKHTKVYFLLDNEEKTLLKAFKYANKVGSLGISTEVITLDLENINDPAEMTDMQVKELKKELKIS